MSRLHLSLALLSLLIPALAAAQRSAATTRPDDAIIYALAINHLFPKAKLVVLQDSTTRGSPIPVRLPSAIGSDTIESSATADLTRRIEAMFSLRGISDSIAAHLTMSVTFIQGDTIRASVGRSANPNEYWQRFYAAYPGANGRMSVSPIGYSSDGNQAVLNVDNGCGGRCGTGHIVLLRRVNGKWVVRGDMGTWVS